MPILLFLSALLSALTGAISGGRVPEAQIHQSAGAAPSAAIASVKRAVSVRHAYAWSALPMRLLSQIHAARPVRAIGWSLAATVPLFLDRLRE